MSSAVDEEGCVVGTENETSCEVAVADVSLSTSNSSFLEDEVDSKYPISNEPINLEMFPNDESKGKVHSYAGE